MRIPYILFCLMTLVSCTKKKCNCTDLILPDIYHLEYTGQSRYACINLPITKDVERKFVFTEQIRAFEYEGISLRFHFYHELIKEDYPIIREREELIQKILDLKFGKVFLEIKGQDSKKFTKLEHEKYSKILSKIEVYEYEAEVPCKGKGNFKPMELEQLKNIGALGWTNYPNKKELHILSTTDDYENCSSLFYDHYILLKEYLDADDILSIYHPKEGKNELLYSFNIIKSSPDIEDDGFCGMGPKKFGIECFYKKN